MCGIVGYIGREHRAMDVLIDGLRRLEYRGYDSAGVAIFEDGNIAVRRAMGKLANLEGILRVTDGRGQRDYGQPPDRNEYVQAQLRDFVSAVQTGDRSRVLTPYKDALKSLRIAISADESLRTERRISLPRD